MNVGIKHVFWPGMLLFLLIMDTHGAFELNLGKSLSLTVSCFVVVCCSSCCCV